MKTKKKAKRKMKNNRILIMRYDKVEQNNEEVESVDEKNVVETSMD